MKLTRSGTINFAWLCFCPLVNVLFLLLIFILLSSNFLIQPGVAVTPPPSSFALGPQINHQIISITNGGAPAVYFRDQRVTMEELTQLLDQAKAEERSIIIKADRGAPYELVSAVANIALERGISTVSLAAAPAR